MTTLDAVFSPRSLKQLEAEEIILDEILDRFHEIPGERRATDSAIEAGLPRPGISGYRSSVTFENPSFTTLSCE